MGKWIKTDGFLLKTRDARVVAKMIDKIEASDRLRNLFTTEEKRRLSTLKTKIWEC